MRPKRSPEAVQCTLVYDHSECDICKNSANNLQLEKFDKEGKSSSGSKLPQKYCVGQGGTAPEAAGTPPPENLCGSEHSPQQTLAAAEAGQEFIFISWNSVDLKSLLNVNFQKAHASAF